MIGSKQLHVAIRSRVPAEAVKDLERLPPPTPSRILEKVMRMQDGLIGDVKRLTEHSPEYRLRVGDYRVLFDIAGSLIVVHRVLHRKDAY